MKIRIVAMSAAAIALVGAAVLLLTGSPTAPTAATAKPAVATIAPLPERAPTPTAPPVAVSDLDRCIASGSCVLMQTEKFSNATVEIYQANAAEPAVHVRTTYLDSAPAVWSLQGEHAATFQSITCGLANCLLQVAIGPETRATIDMRMSSHQLSGQIEGAAVGGSLSTQAVDLNGDGVLDLLSAEHLVRSDGTELFFYRTYVNQDRTLVPTGCSEPSADPIVPATLQTRICPAAV